VTTSRRGSTRILQVIYGGMARTGLETWLMHVLRHIDRERFQMDFAVQIEGRPYEDEIRALGSKVIPCRHHRQPLTYARNFRRILHDQGPYDVVHSHFHYYSGYVLRLAHQAAVPIRIAHSHNDTSQLDAERGRLYGMYIRLMRRWIAQNATVGLACSRVAASALLGGAWELDPRWRILYNGIDLKPFQFPSSPLAVRAELGIPADAFVVGHVGRFHKQKNHAFLVDIAAELVKREPRAYLLLVGDGPLRTAIERRVSEVGIADKVIFLGVRRDVPRLMLGAMDAFVLPSFYEGLPLVGIEAQAAGLPYILSDAITEEADCITPLIKRLSLSQPASVWAAAILEVRYHSSSITQREALRLVENSPFSIAFSVKALEEIYDG
jgi:glycosyltransferase involved in cell wall biosynthesis